MITIQNRKIRVPKDEAFIGFAGDNNGLCLEILVAGKKEPNWLYKLYLLFDDGTCNYFILDSKITESGTVLTWNILKEHIYKSGVVQMQIKAFQNTSVVYHTNTAALVVGDSIEFSDYFAVKDNQLFADIEAQMEELLARLENLEIENGSITPEKLAERYKPVTVMSYSTNAVNELDLNACIRWGYTAVSGNHKVFNVPEDFGNNGTGGYQILLDVTGLTGPGVHQKLTKIVNSSVSEAEFLHWERRSAYAAAYWTPWVRIHSDPASKLADGAVTTNKLADGAVTTEKIAAAAVGDKQIRNYCITSDKLLGGAVIEGKINGQAVVTANLKDSAVTSIKLAKDCITPEKLSAGCVITDKIADKTITGAKIVAGAVGSALLSSRAVTKGKVASRAVPLSSMDFEEIAVDGGSIPYDAYTTMGVYKFTGAFYPCFLFVFTQQDSYVQDNSIYQIRIGVNTDTKTAFRYGIKNDGDTVVWGQWQTMTADLSGYYTKQETDTAIQNAADGITEAVNRAAEEVANGRY